MKIDEFMQKVGRHTRVQKRKGEIEIYGNSLNDYDWLFSFNPKDSGFAIWTNWGNAQGLAPETVAKIIDLMIKLRNTPVKERFPEKKYRLVWQEDDFYPWILGYDNDGDWEINNEGYLKSINYQTRFTDSELKRIAGDDKKMFDRLNAVKEPAEEDE